MRMSEKIDLICKAMAEMQGQMGIASKDSKGFNYKYADLASVWSVIRVPLHANGLFVMQEALTVPEGVAVSTTVFHQSGQWIGFEPLIVPMGKRDAHSTGSAVTYGKRYSLTSCLGIVTDDDDGAAAQKGADKKAIKPAARVITDEEYEKLEKYIGEDDELRGVLIKLCGVTRFKDMNIDQLEACRAYIKANK